MAGSRSILEIVIDVKNAATGGKQIREVGTASSTAGKQAEGGGRDFAGMAKKMAAIAGGAIVAKKGFDFMKGAANDAITLAKATGQVTRNTGMDERSSSAWVSMTKQRGIETKALTTSFTAFSKQLRATEQGSKGTVQAFSDLGIQAKDLKGADFQDSLLRTADAFEKLPAGADKAALATKLFGKQGLTLLPLLNSGSKGILEQQKAMQDAGLTMDKDGVSKSLELAKAQREMNTAMAGVKQQIGQALVPMIASIAKVILPVVQAIAKFINSSGILRTLLPILAVALGVATVAVWAMNSALLANPITWVVLALGALVAGLVYAYNNVTVFRNVVTAAFNAIKTVVGAVVGFVTKNWKTLAAILATLLLGPLGGAAVAFVLFKDKALAAIGAVVDFVKTIPGKIGSALSSLAGTVKNAFTHAFSSVVGIAKAPINMLIRGWNNLSFEVPKVDLGPLGSIGGGRIGVPKIPELATGGTFRSGGLAIVGDRGPELAQFPAGARIAPLTQATQTAIPLGGFGGGDLHIHLDVEGRELAHVIATQTQLQAATR